jgi:hypothetical protein
MSAQMQPDQANKFEFCAVKAKPGPFAARIAILKLRCAVEDPEEDSRSIAVDYKKRHFPADEAKNKLRRTVHQAIVTVADTLEMNYEKDAADMGRCIAVLDSLIQAGEQLETAVAIASFTP